MQGGADRGRSARVQALEDLRGLVADACARARLDRSGWLRQNTSNGEVSLVPATVPRLRMAVDLVQELASALRRQNGDRAVTERLRLRVAIHHGAPRPDTAAGTIGGGFGPPATVVRRMLDAPQVSFSLDVRRADLALIVSDGVFQEVRELPPGGGFRPDSFRRVRVRDRGVDPVHLDRPPEAPAAGLLAWIQVPERDASTGAAPGP